MRKGNGGLTRVEAVVLAGVATILLFFIFQSARNINYRYSPRRRISCMGNLHHIGAACYMYQDTSDGFLPAYWDGERFDPMMSLALLYPSLVPSADTFRCPDTKDRPVITVKQVNGNGVKSFGPVNGKNKCSYFYDPLTYFRDIGSGQAIAADADGMAWQDAQGEEPEYPDNWQRMPRKPNHKGGQYVIYFDTSVEWADTNYASDDPMDNIFCPNEGWGADTDAYLWDGVNAREAVVEP